MGNARRPITFRHCVSIEVFGRCSIGWGSHAAAYAHAAFLRRLNLGHHGWRRHQIHIAPGCVPKYDSIEATRSDDLVALRDFMDLSLRGCDP
jgi:hypothetical protein